MDCAVERWKRGKIKLTKDMKQNQDDSSNKGTEEEAVKIKRLFIKIRSLCGELGEIEDPCDGKEEIIKSDAEMYDFQVKLGMARAANELFDFDIKEVIRWFGYCIIGTGIEITPRIECLLDSRRQPRPAWPACQAGLFIGG